VSEDAQVVAAQQVYRWWWLHDGRWYQEVAQRFGHAAANEANRAALHFVARRVAQTIHASLNRPLSELTWPEVVEVYRRCASAMWPQGLAAAEYSAPAVGELRIVIRRTFILATLRLAGSSERYECPCLAVHEGWFEGLGLQPVDQQVTGCLREGDSGCTFLCRTRWPLVTQEGKW
jgi:hypothetical protein